MKEIQTFNNPALTLTSFLLSMKMVDGDDQFMNMANKVNMVIGSDSNKNKLFQIREGCQKSGHMWSFTKLPSDPHPHPSIDIFPDFLTLIFSFVNKANNG